MESRFELVLKQKIEERIKEHLDFLAQSGAKDYSQYTYYCGLIEGLKEITTLCDETRRDLIGD